MYQLIENGAIHLSALVLLRDHLTEENQTELLREASGKSKRNVESLLARRFPKPDAPSRIRKLAKDALDASSAERDEVEPARSEPARPPPTATKSANECRVEPLSAARYKVQFTADAALKEKLERARNLLSHANPNGDLAVVVDRAVDLLLRDLEKKKLAKTTRPGRTRSTKPGAVTRAARREIFTRDGVQCSFVDARGRRCQARAFLELDHVHARALGGTGNAENVRVLCRPHNRLMAEQTFGREHVEQCIQLRQRKYAAKRAPSARTEPAPAPSEPRRGTLERPAAGTANASSDETYEKLIKALTHNGFRTSAVRAALEKIRAGKSSVAPAAPIEELLREAVLLLTSGDGSKHRQVRDVVACAQSRQ